MGDARRSDSKIPFLFPRFSPLVSMPPPPGPDELWRGKKSDHKQSHSGQTIAAPVGVDAITIGGTWTILFHAR
jgi:hypothetical protein